MGTQILTPADTDLVSALTIAVPHNKIGHERYVLKHGTLMTPRPLPRDVIGRNFVPERLRVGACFAVAHFLATLNRDLQYVEGFALSSSSTAPFLHAWCVDAHNCVVDVAWGQTCGMGLAYYGIVFDLADPRFTHLWGGSLIDDWKHGYPLLQPAV